MTKGYANLIRNMIIIVFGNLVYAAGVVFFILPGGLITGGTTGIALTVNQLTGIEISLFVGIFNLAMFAVGALFLGKEFAITTLLSTISYPVLLGMLQKAAGDFVLTEDKLLCALFGGLCIGAALAMIIRLGASTGGMDIPPLLLKKFLRIPVSVSLYVFDVIILIGQMAYSDRQSSLYGILLVIVYSLALDKLLAAGDSRTRLEIISRNPEAIRDAIMQKADRGVTMIHCRTGYLDKETDIVYTVVAPRELYKIEKLIHEIDPTAFIVLDKVSSVTGKGFTAEKEYL
ncbi:MAG: YitT family protein [Anaerovoracaceae bacterium]